MSLLRKLEEQKSNIATHRWTIRQVLDAGTGLPKQDRRKRVGAVVRILRPVSPGIPLHLLFSGGPKDGAIVQLSRIVKVEEPEGTKGTISIVTQGGTLVTLELVDEEKVRAFHRGLQNDMYGGDGDGADV